MADSAASPAENCNPYRPVRVIVVGETASSVEECVLLFSRMADFELAARSASLAKALKMLPSVRPDLIILDPGFSPCATRAVLAAIPDPLASMSVIATWSRDHASKAFERGVFDYLVKPLRPERMLGLAARARRRRQLLEAEAKLLEQGHVPGTLPSGKTTGLAYERELWVRHRGTEQLRVPVTEIDWIDTQDDYACVHARGREHLVRISLRRLVPLLDPQRFVQIHRSTIVNVDKVARLRRKAPGVREAVLVDGTVLPCGRVHWRTLAWRENGRSTQRGRVSEQDFENRPEPRD